VSSLPSIFFPLDPRIFWGRGRISLCSVTARMANATRSDCPLPTSPISSVSFRPRRLWLCSMRPHFMFVLDRGWDMGLAASGGG
jgi:hypothetical protein